MFQQNTERTNLSAEVPPFVPRKDELGVHLPPSPLPRYVTTCYPFVQEQQDHARHMVASPLPQPLSVNSSSRWPGHTIVAPTSYMAPPTHNHNIEVNYQGNIADSVQVSAVYGDTLQQTNTQLYQEPTSSSSSKNSKVTKRNVGIQKEVGMRGPDPGDPVMIDNSQQTDFPISIACKSLTDKPSPLKKATRNRRRRVVMATEGNYDSSSDHADADVDSDSGYYSPKRRLAQKKNGGSSTTESWRDERGSNQPHNQQSVAQRVVYMPPTSVPPPTLLYHVHPSPSPQLHPNAQHVTPPPSGQILGYTASGTPLIVNPPPSTMMNPIPITSRPPPGFPMPPVMMKQHNPMQLPNGLIWNGSHYLTPNYNPPSNPTQQYQPQNRNNNMGDRRYNAPQQERRKPNGNNPLNSYPGNEPRFDKRKQDRRKPANTPGILAMAPSSYEGNVKMQHEPSTNNPFYLADNQDFPGLGGSSYAQTQYSPYKLSYSQAVSQKPGTRSPVVANMVQPQQNNNKTAEEISMQEKVQKSRKRWKKAERASKAADEEYAEISKEQENIKKVLRKTANNRNRSKAPVLDLGEIFSKLEVKSLVGKGGKNPAASNSGKNVIQIAGGIPIRDSTKTSGTTQRYKSNITTPMNALDASAPTQKRGKEREIPKPKKPSALKKVILKEREEKKEQRLHQLTTMNNPDHDVPPYPSAILNPVSADVAATNEAGDEAQLSVDDVPSSVPQIHSRRYREYCCQVLDKKIDETCTIILQKLVQFQDRLYQKDPIKAKMRRRLVMGLREVTKHLKLKKLKCVIISPNLEKIQSKGGLDDALQQILNMCETQNVTYIFALGRKAMGRAVLKLVPVSIIGIFDYSGVEDHYKQLVELVSDAQNKYKDMVSIYQQEVIDANAPPVPVPSTSTKRFAHMTHSRNPSAASCVSFASFISEPISEMNEGSNWRVMMDAGEGSTLSPPPEVDGSSDEERTSHIATKTSDHDNVSRKDSGSTVVDCKAVLDWSEAPINEEDVENSPSSDHHSLSDSSDYEDSSNKLQKCLEQSFSTTSTVVAPTKQFKPENHNSPQQTTSMSRLSKPPLIEDDSLMQSIDGASPADVQDRIHMWLEDTRRTVHDIDVDDDVSMSSQETLNKDSSCDVTSTENTSDS